MTRSTRNSSAVAGFRSDNSDEDEHTRDPKNDEPPAADPNHTPVANPKTTGEEEDGDEYILDDKDDDDDDEDDKKESPKLSQTERALYQKLIAGEAEDDDDEAELALADGTQNVLVVPAITRGKYEVPDTLPTLHMGIYIPMSMTTKTLYALPNKKGIFSCNQDNAKYVKDLLAAIAAHVADKTADRTFPERSYYTMASDLIKYETKRFNRIYPELGSDATTDRNLKQMRSLLEEFTIENSPYKKLFRVAAVYASQRLGMPKYRLNGNEVTHAYRAVRDSTLFDEKMVIASSSTPAIFMVGTMILRDFLSVQGIPEFHVGFAGHQTVEPQETFAANNQRRCIRAGKVKIKFTVEKRPEVVTRLKAIIDTYKSNEKKWFGTDSDFLARTAKAVVQTPSSGKKRKRDDEDDDVLLPIKTPRTKVPEPGGVPF